MNKNQRKKTLLWSKGQALAEFVILLTVLMAMAAGMIYVSRLLNFQFWARQEARLMAFRWIGAARQGQITPIDILPQVVTKAPSYVKKSFPTSIFSDQGNFQSIATLDRKEKQTDANRINNSEEIFLANNTKSIWDRKTEDWIKDDFFIANRAFAMAKEIGPSDSWRINQNRESAVEEGFIDLLEMTEFGKRFCRAVSELLKSNSFPVQHSIFTKKECAKDYDTLFGIFLARNINFRDLFAHYGKLLQSGKTPEQAAELIGEREIKNQFYSLFDKKIKKALQDSMTTLVEGADSTILLLDGSFANLIWRVRYQGGVEALKTIWDFKQPLHNYSSARKLELEKLREQTRNKILHADILNDPNYGSKYFNINPFYSPIPPDFTKVQPKLFDGVMKNVMSREQSTQNVTIKNTNREVKVGYSPQKGFFNYLFGRFSTNNTKLFAKYFIVDESWEIKRQQRRLYHFGWGASFKYRELGSEDDSMSDETEEAWLRKRIYGLWLVPTYANEMLSPLGELASSEMGEVTTSLGEVLNAPGFVKDQLATLLEGPGLGELTHLVNSVAAIPEIVGLDFTPPRLPTARPTAYPNSPELVNDNLIGPGTNRTIWNYQAEQITNYTNNP